MNLETEGSLKKQFLSMIVLIGTLVLSLCACGGENPSAADDLAVIDAESILQYQVVRSDYADGDLVKCGMDVRYAFEDAGYELKLTTDFFREGYPEYAMGDCEILVGETNRPESAEFLDSLQMWQYGYALVGQKIVIAGHDEKTTRQAVEDFRTFLAERTADGAPFTFSAADNYIYGEVKEGQGKVYSVLTYDFTRSNETDVTAEIEEYSPDFVIVRNADFAAANVYLPDGYALGANFSPDGTENGRRDIMYYNTDTYTYSSEGSLMLSQMPMLTENEKGWFSYCVVRCAETKEKMVFCSADLSGVPANAVRERLKVFGGFAEHCAGLPVLFGGLYDGAVDSPACSALTEYGYADVFRLAGESDGEGAGMSLYASYNNIAVVKSVVTGHGLYAEFQRAE